MRANATVVTAAFCLSALIGCVVDSPNGSSEPQNQEHTLHNGVPWVDPHEIRPAATGNLVYYGGRVVSDMRVVQVIWGTGSYLSNVTSTATPSMATFYQQVLNSNYVAWLDHDYNTVTPSPANGSTKTNQHIGAGSFVGQYTITPSVTGTVDDSQIQSEIAAQIQAGHLPAPTTDSAGNTNTYYAIFFPHGTTITQGGSSSCVAGGFCAYHGTISNAGGHEVYYGVHPDMQPGSGCDTGCGSSTAFGNYTSVASHEMVETITDAEVGLATTYGPPLAWYDNTNGEIGDICNANQGTFTGSDGVTYTIQNEWSNSQGACISQIPGITFGGGGDDFSIAASPTSLSLNPGGSGTSTITTAITSGSAEAVSLSLSGAPSGVTGSFSPSSITGAGSATLTINTTSSAAPGTYALTVTGTASSGSHTASISLTIQGTSTGGGITNGGFEAGNFTGWNTAGTTTVVSSGAHGGTFAAQVGGTTPTNGDSTISQTFTVPSGANSLGFYYQVHCPDTVQYDWATATLTTGSTTTTILTKDCSNTGAWKHVTVPVTAGTTYTLKLISHDDDYAGDPTYTLFDDVTLGTATSTGGITNGGFETGTLSGWTASGASNTVIASGCHGGTYCAQAGSTSPTNGNSTITQTFTVPSGKTAVSVWYASTCPDTVTYDWVTITLKDVAANTTKTLLAKTCDPSGTWKNVTGSVTAGRSYTLTLTNRDDNYAGDATFTKFDDVTLQ